jgi:hypothetical protein
MTADHKEVLRLGSIVQQFNEAVAGYLENEPAIGAQLQTILEQDPALEEELAEQAMNLIEAAFAADEHADDTDSEEYNALAAACSIAFVNAFLEMFQRAGLEDHVAQFFPKQEKTIANAIAFDAANAPNVARLCLK